MHKQFDVYNQLNVY